MANVPLRVFDQNLTLVAEIDDYESLYFTRSWYDVGDFSLTINYNKLYAPTLTKGAIVQLGGRPDSTGIILSVTRDVGAGAGGKGSEQITATGCELKYILRWRISYPPTGQDRYIMRDAAETVIKTFVNDQCGSAAPAARQFPLFAVNADQSRGSEYLISARYSVVADELIDCAWASGLSWRVNLDLSTKQYVFEIYEGLDRTAAQAVNPRVIFSPKYDTVQSAQIKTSDLTYRSLMVVGGQGVGAARTIVLAHSGTEPTGLARREQWVDARDLSATPDLAARGAQKLIEYSNQNFFTGKALPYSAVQYRTDYDLGDVVTMSAFGETTDVRVASAREAWVHNRYDIELGFGRPHPTITTRVAKNQNETSSILNANE